VSDWQTTQQDFRRKALQHDGTRREIADMLNMTPDTFYRLFRGEVQHPCRAVRKNVEDYVSEVGRPEPDGEGE